MKILGSSDTSEQPWAKVSIIVTTSNQEGVQTKTLSDTISWFKANFLSFSFNKTYYLEFRNKICIGTTVDVNYFNKTIANIPYKNFLCLLTDDTVTWDNHIIKLISRLNSACYAITTVKQCCQGKLSECCIFHLYIMSYHTAYFLWVTSLVVLSIHNAKININN